MKRSAVDLSVDDGGLRLELQPVIDLRTGVVRAFEALARWEVAGQLLTPHDVLPDLSAEDVDLLFQQVLERVLRHVRDWDLEGIEVDVSVNVDPRTLREPQCGSWVAAALERHSVRAERLSIEVLETGPVDSDVQTETLARLRQTGVRLGMDDFGAGYSTVARLNELPFDVVKIDRSLVGLLLRDPRSAAARIDELVSTAIDHGCEIVSEGVEHPSLAEAVRILGSDLVQGYLYACPMPPEAVPDWIRSWPMSCPPEPVTTILGAFAYHWRYASTGRGHPGKVDDCVMSAVVAEEAGDANGSAARWHAGQHGDRVDPAAARALEDWLVARVVGD